MEDKKIPEEIKEIVLFRIESSKLPENIKLSIGNLSSEPLSKEEIIEHIKKEDEIGRKIIEMEIAYLKALKEGIIPKIQK